MSTPSPPSKRYADVTALERIAAYLSLLPLPAILVWTALFRRSQKKSLKRVLHDRAVQHLVGSMHVPQLQSYLGTTRETYEAWCKKENLEPVVEDVDGGAPLLWIGERNLDKVILYFHGGGFLIPPMECNISFLYHARNKMKQSGINVGVAMLQYTLVPEATFPTPLKQAVAAINHLTSLNVNAQNIQFVGDSAGGNLILQVLSHMLHPLESENIPPLSLSTPFKGAYLMSPWVALSDKSNTFSTADETDILTASTLNYWGSEVLNGVPAKHLGYIEANSAADNWWKGVDALVHKVLITSGEEECLNSEIVRFATTFDKFHASAQFAKKQGVHNEPFMDLDVGVKDGEVSTLAINWLISGFQD